MHTATHLAIPTDILNVPSIDLDEINAMIAAQWLAPSPKPGVRLVVIGSSERHDARNRR
jgi:hypothetical protein